MAKQKPIKRLCGGILFLFLTSCTDFEERTVYSTDTLHVHIGQELSTPQMVVFGDWGFDEQGEETVWILCKIYNSFENTIINPKMFGSIYTDGNYVNLVDRDSSFFYQTVAGVGDTMEWVQYLEIDNVAYALVYLYPPNLGSYYYSAWVEWK